MKKPVRWSSVQPHPPKFWFNPSFACNCPQGFYYLGVILFVQWIHIYLAITHVLHFCLLFFQLWMQPEQKQICPAFNNLKKLSILCIHVEFDLLWTINLLEAAPSVELLCIDVSFLFFLIERNNSMIVTATGLSLCAQINITKCSY